MHASAFCVILEPSPEHDRKENSELSSSCLTRRSRAITTYAPAFRFFQSGRSMVEMLGTLAIIGVLSIGGIMGYSYGMDKYRANETMQAVTLRGIDVLAQFDRTGDANLNEWQNERGVFPAHIKNILTFNSAYTIISKAKLRKNILGGYTQCLLL